MFLLHSRKMSFGIWLHCLQHKYRLNFNGCCKNAETIIHFRQEYLIIGRHRGQASKEFNQFYWNLWKKIIFEILFCLRLIHLFIVETVFFTVAENRTNWNKVEQLFRKGRKNLNTNICRPQLNSVTTMKRKHVIRFRHFC